MKSPEARAWENVIKLVVQDAQRNITFMHRARREGNGALEKRMKAAAQDRVDKANRLLRSKPDDAVAPTIPRIN